jgi:hypothetical protein
MINPYSVKACPSSSTNKFFSFFNILFPPTIF